LDTYRALHTAIGVEVTIDPLDGVTVTWHAIAINRTLFRGVGQGEAPLVVSAAVVEEDRAFRCAIPDGEIIDPYGPRET